MLERMSIAVLRVALCLLPANVSTAWVFLAVLGAADPRVVEEAKREGKLTWYATTNVEDARRFIAAFNEKYPFIQVQSLRMGSGRAVNRLETEARAGTVNADVLNVNDVESVRLVEKGFFAKYSSPELAHFPKHLLDPAGYALPFKNIPRVIGYSTRYVSPSEAPTRYEDLLEPKWKGKILMDPGDFTLYSGFLQHWGQERARSFLQRLSRQEIQWRPGQFLLAQGLAAGESSIGLIFANHAEMLRAKGAPIDWDNRLDPIFLSANVNFILAKAPHPNAARLFADFTLSKESQMILADTWRITPYPGVAPKTKKLDPKNLKLLMIDSLPDRILQQHIEDWKAIFGLK
jgi:iron(III) transport system substrate-binding protein